MDQRLGNFTQEEVSALYAQHTEETGQVFERGVTEYVFAQTGGQPWLVNALGYEACFRTEEGRKRSRPITLAGLEDARERLIERRDTHLDQLADKLREPRVRRVISELLASTSPTGPPPTIRTDVRAGSVIRVIPLDNFMIYKDIIRLDRPD